MEAPLSETLDEVCREFAPRIRLYGLKRLRSEAAADDLVQEVLAIVLRALESGQVRDHAALAGYVLGTCRNVIRRQATLEGRRRELLERFPLDLRPDPDPPRHALDYERLGTCITRLPQKEHRVILATFYGGASAQAIAAELATTAGNVRTLRHRALASLRRCLEGGRPT